MAFLIGASGGALFLPTSATVAVDVYQPVQRPLPDPSPYYEIVGDLWKNVEGMEVVEAVWKSVLLFLSGEMLQYLESMAARSLRDIPILSQRKWMRFLIEHKEDFVNDPGWTASGNARFVYSGGALAAVWANRLGTDAYQIPLRSLVTQDALLEWSSEFTMTAMPTPPAGKKALALFGYSSEEGADGIYVGVGKDNQVVLAHVEDSGQVTLLFSVASLVQVGVRYRLSASYLGDTGALTAVLTSLDVLQVDRTGVGQGGAAIDDADIDPFTRLFQDTAIADFAALGVVAGSSRLVLVDPATGLEVFTTAITSVALDTVGLEESVLVPGVGPMAYRIYGEAIVTTLDLNVRGAATDDRFVVGCFGVRNLDLQSRSPQGTTWLALGMLEGNAISGTVHELTYSDPSVDARIRDIPYLQPNPASDAGRMEQPGDFSYAGGQLVFLSTPPPLLYAEYVRVDEGVIEANFGSLVGLEGASTEAYLAAVQALFYAFFRGATPTNVHRGVHIYMGLPIALEAGTVVSVNAAYSGDMGLITVQGEKLRSYQYPLTVGTALLPNDVVVQYQVLCKGVQVRDYISEPTWWLPYIGSGFNELQKFHSFEVVIDADVFDLSAVASAAAFVNDKRFRQTWKTAWIRIIEAFSDTVPINDSLFINGRVVITDPIYQQNYPRYDAAVAWPGLSFEADGYEPLFRGEPSATWLTCTGKTPAAFGWERSQERGADGLWTGSAWSMGSSLLGRLQHPVLHDQTRLIPETVVFLIWDTVLASWTQWEDNGSGEAVCTSHTKYAATGPYRISVDYDTGNATFGVGAHDLTDVWACYATQYVHVPGSANVVNVPFVDWWYDQTPDPTTNPTDLALDYVDPATGAGNLNDTRVAHPTGFSWPVVGADLTYEQPPSYDPLVGVPQSTKPGVGASADPADPGQPGSSQLLLVGGEEVSGPPPDAFYDGYSEQGPEEQLTVVAIDQSGTGPTINWFGTPTALPAGSPGTPLVHTETEPTLSYP